MKQIKKINAALAATNGEGIKKPFSKLKAGSFSPRPK